jgi:hypothetical protein
VTDTAGGAGAAGRPGAPGGRPAGGQRRGSGGAPPRLCARPPPANRRPPQWWQRQPACCARGPQPGAREPHRPARSGLLSPEQTFFLRENLKLKLLNARLGLLARQTESARADLAAAAAALSSISTPRRAAPRPRPRLLQQVQAQLKVRRICPAWTKPWPRWPQPGRRGASHARRTLVPGPVWRGRGHCTVCRQQPGHGHAVLAALPGRPVAQPGAAAAGGRLRVVARGAARAGSPVGDAAAGPALARPAERAGHARCHAGCLAQLLAGRFLRSASRRWRRWRRKNAGRAGEDAPPMARRSGRWRICWRPRAPRPCRTAPPATSICARPWSRPPRPGVDRSAQQETHEGALLRAARWALDDRDPPAAVQLAGSRCPRAPPAARWRCASSSRRHARRARPPTRWTPRACWPSTGLSRPWRRKASCGAWPWTCSTAPTIRPSCSAPGTRWSRPSAHARAGHPRGPAPGRAGGDATWHVPGCCRCGSSMGQPWATARA